ncbi:MAG TPA: hypothetical protein PLL09_10035 [Flavobacterium sp.]|uniref:hypothetical protein n=1 Tax=unclassified Flavobacterium TaxID=196869 RepID=UPI0025C697C0|nr:MULTISPECIES: hypothetical protein [unclassified Flavobacterium]HRE78149.1 hypothetical protein [Flavobacterium sp.]
MEIDYNAIKSKVERERCTEHNQNAKFTKTRDGYCIKTCCEKFEKKIAKKAETFLEKEIENLLNKMLR